MFINHCNYIELPRREVKRIPRERYKRYFHDLYKISNRKLSEETFEQGDQYSYTDIIDTIIESNIPMDMNEQISDVVFSYWTPEWDPSHSAFATYFLYKTGIDSEIFDVCDVGTISTSTALHILMNTDSKDDRRTKILVGMEQTSIPRLLDDQNIVPMRSSGTIMFLSNANDSDATYKVEHSEYINENRIYQESFAVGSAVTNMISEYSLCAEDVRLVMKRCSSSFKEIDYLSDKNEIERSYVNDALYLPNMYSANELPRVLKKLSMQSEEHSNQHWIYIDEDAESRNTILTLIRKT